MGPWIVGGRGEMINDALLRTAGPQPPTRRASRDARQPRRAARDTLPRDNASDHVALRLRSRLQRVLMRCLSQTVTASASMR
jgi:hypothetical protein